MRTAPIISPIALLAAVLFLLTPRCLAQAASPALPPTTAPAAPALPAVEGAYEHDSLRRPDAGSVAVNGGKAAAPANSPYSAPLDIKRVAISLAIVLSLVFGCRWAIRWMFPSVAVGRSSQVMKVLSRSVIAPKQQLLLIQVGRRLVVVGDCGQQMNALAQIDDPDEVASLLGQLNAGPSEEEIDKPFGPLLGNARRQFDNIPVSAAIDSDDEEPDLAIAGVDQTRGELTGLTEKIRMLSQQLGKT